MANHLSLDPLVVAQLGNLQMRARRILDGLYSGRHTNLNYGHAQDFSEHRPYNPGDDLRSLDWKVFGRTDRLVVKQYEEQTNVAGTVVLDDSASMGFSDQGRLTKLEYAKTMAAALGYLMVSQHDAVGLRSSHQVLRPNSQRGALDRYFEALDSMKPQGVLNVEALHTSLLENARKKGFIFFFSDFMTQSDLLIKMLTNLNALKHEVLVFQVLDPSEIELPFSGPVLFEDMESGEKIQTDPEMIRDSYRQWVEQQLQSFSHVFRSVGVDYFLLTTDLPFDKGMGKFLSWRTARL